MAGLGIFAWFSYPLDISERLKLIKQAGFDAVSLWWGEDDRQSQPGMARALGLEIDNVHAPFANQNSLWREGNDGDAYLNTLMTCVDDCRKHAISTVVIHLTSCRAEPEITSCGMERLSRLVERAEKQNVNLAFENLLTLRHVDCALKNFNTSRVGFCYDSGHEHCFHPRTDCLSNYGSRLFAIHLDDNMGDADAHLPPYDGTVDWEKIQSALPQCKQLDFYTLEVNFDKAHDAAKQYASLTAPEYLALARERLQKFVNGIS